MPNENLTPFGSACRDIRITAKMRMIDQAKQFSCSPSFISSVETGEKQPPEGYVQKFCDWLRLDNVTRKHLQLLADARSNVIRFVPVDRERAALARRLFRTINKMSPSDIKKLNMSLNGDDK
ncbi:helix-turn-helix domain-containing protein [Mesorhizobium sp. B3-1-3]|uniref:helix-turn-helix domain-containing protein n=1 Tax=unclassified Mesorhizobium TaxID=325217 RepID=UPI001128F3A3|nr:MULTISPECIES: helix-turn-helix transcriptional regulator [unclassified Mesorhizobium]TPI68136.1 helix-turn-helix domain-containing protein [Mesorhizobium sp. B3-1-8]TPI73419.1 helix-turn-helix domain-containing protein [Mesorhizobium sp. B3-1-3]